MVVPQTAMFSFFHQLSDSVALLGNVGWQDWSEYGKLGIVLAAENSKSLLVDRSYDDSYHLALGTQIDIDGPWLLSGVLLSTPVSWTIPQESRICPTVTAGDLLWADNML